MEIKTKKKSMTNYDNSIRISGAEAVIRCLLEEGADLVYGYPGGAIMPIYDELYKYQDKLHHVLTRHEQGAAHSAQGFARTSRKVGVAMATSGPGATNLVRVLPMQLILHNGVYYRTSCFSSTWI